MLYDRNTRKKKHKKQKSHLRRLINRTLLIITFFFLGSLAGLSVVFYYLSFDLPPIGPLLEGYDPPQTTRFLASDGTVIGEIYLERRTLVAIKNIPDVLLNAVIAAEDADFRTHEGLDYVGMIRAMVKNVTKGKLAQGASTITQQVARTFFLTRTKTFSRKIREMLLTKNIEERLTKDEILYLYLNQINFGHARYGVGEASLFYFGKKIEEITISEAALLAGIPKGPSIYEPFGHPNRATKRRAYVIGEMEKNGFITPSQAILAKKAPLGLVKQIQKDTYLAPEAISRAISELKTVISSTTLKHGGYTIYTSLKPDLQRAAKRALKTGLYNLDKRHGRLAPYKKRKWPKNPKRKKGNGTLYFGQVYIANVVGHDNKAGKIIVKIGDRNGFIQIKHEQRYNPKDLIASKMAEIGAKLRVSLRNTPQKDKPIELQLEFGAQAAVVSIDPLTGQIVALVGGYNVKPGGFNRATQSKRQPGSAFKPFVYLEAIRSRRYTAASKLDDSPVVEGEWQPKNSHKDGYKGAVTMREALAQSLNLPTIKLIQDIGPDNVVLLAKQLGINSKLESGSALALGSSGVTPLEMADAYATLASGGIKRGPWIVNKVIGPNGEKIPLFGRTEKEVLTKEDAYIITSMLQSVIKNGTGKKARALKRQTAGKTGTTNNAKDAWFVGYTHDLSTSVWVGFDVPRSLGRREYGGRAALPIWLEFMKRAHKNIAKTDFIKPQSIISREIDPSNGLLAYVDMEDPVTEIFIEGTEPTEISLPPEVLSLDGFLMDQAYGDQDGGTQGMNAIINDAGL